MQRPPPLQNGYRCHIRDPPDNFGLIGGDLGDLSIRAPPMVEVDVDDIPDQRWRIDNRKLPMELRLKLHFLFDDRGEDVGLPKAAMAKSVCLDL